MVAFPSLSLCINLFLFVASPTCAEPALAELAAEWIKEHPSSTHGDGLVPVCTGRVPMMGARWAPGYWGSLCSLCWLGGWQWPLWGLSNLPPPVLPQGPHPPPAHQAGLGVKGGSVHHPSLRPAHTRGIVLIGCKSSLASGQRLAELQEEDIKAQETEMEEPGVWH